MKIQNTIIKKSSLASLARFNIFVKKRLGIECFYYVYAVIIIVIILSFYYT